MNDEQDSWFKNAFGLDLGGAAQRVEDEARQLASQAHGAVTQVVQGVQSAVEGAIDSAVGAATGVAKKVVAAAGGGAGGSSGSGATGSFPLGGSVGRGGQNRAGDVKAVQRALGIADDGQCGGQTIGAIEAFQRKMGLPKADGRVDPGGATERAMAGGRASASAANTLSAPDDSGGRPALAEDNIPRVENVTVLDQVEVEGEPANDTPAGPAPTATIAVRAKGDGSFTVTGSGFSQPDVSIRVVDDAMNERWFPTRTQDGKLTYTTPAVCVREGPIHFSVLAGTYPIVSDLLSNIAHSHCGAAKDEKDEKEKDEPKESEDEAEKVNAGLKTTYSLKVRYWIWDLTAGKMLVDGEKHGPNEEIWFDCANSGAPDTGRVVYWRDSNEDGGGETEKREVIVTADTVTNMQF
jgi:hypothetical protein